MQSVPGDPNNVSWFPPLNLAVPAATDAGLVRTAPLSDAVWSRARPSTGLDPVALRPITNINRDLLSMKVRLLV